MSTTEQLQELLEILHDENSAAQSPVTEPDKLLEHISDQLRQLKEDHDRLADELFVCYDQLNVAFEATETISRCHTISEATDVLLKSIMAATDSRYCHYRGKLANRYSLLDNEKLSNSNAIVQSRTPQYAEAAQRFFRTYQQDVQTLFDRPGDAHVQILDYKVDQNDHDCDGRGNVMMVRLVNKEKQVGHLGDMIFVRQNDQDLFSAVDLHMAQTLARVGAAALGNIVYADKLQQTYLQTITSLVRAMEAKDTYTCGHSTRVAQVACQLGKHLGLNSDDVQLLEWAGLMHDIGKIGISDNVLCKPGRLDDEEYKHIKSHPVKSHKVLEPIEGLHAVLAIVRHHHEHFDGTGYPDGLVGQEIPYLARVIQVADIWDALTSTRSYRKAMAPATAMQIMLKEAGTTMDPELVDQFHEMMIDEIETAEPPAQDSMIVS